MFRLSFKTQLETAILWLEELIDSKEQKEASYQEFFEKNPVVFTALGYKNFYVFTKEGGRDLPRDEYTGLKPEPDFIVERDDGLFEIFEIKTPVSKKLRVNSNNYRERFTAEVSSYISQTVTYEKYFTRNPDNRRKVRELHGLDIHEDLDIKLIIGLNDHVDKVKVHQKAREYSYKVDIVTYDDILNRLINEHDRLFSDYEGLPGFSFHFIVRFRNESARRKKYFLDIGQTIETNRISLYLDEHNNACFDVIDEIGKRYQVEIDTGEIEVLDEWVYLVCEFGKAESGFVMSIAVNGNEKDKRVKNTRIELAVPFEQIMLGCDLNEKNFGRFDVADQVIYSQTLEFRDKYQMLGYFARKYTEDLDINTYVEFDGQRFMHKNEAGNFVQEMEELKPVLRTNDSD